MTRINDKYRRMPLNFLFDDAAIEQWRADRQAFLDERKRKNDEEVRERLRREHAEHARLRKIREAELYQLKQAKKAADRYRQLAGAACGLELSEEALEAAGRKDLRFMDYPYLLDNIHTTEDFALRWLHDSGVDISD